MITNRRAYRILFDLVFHKTIMPLFCSPGKEVLIERDGACPNAPVKTETNSSSSSASSSGSSAGGDINVNVFDGEDFCELIDNTVECTFGILDELHASKRMFEGYWSDIPAKRHFINKKLISCLVDLTILKQNIRDASVMVLEGADPLELDRSESPKTVMDLDMYLKKENTMEHQTVFNTMSI